VTPGGSANASRLAAEDGGRGPRSLSVAMATYNGARFIEAQLASIATQTCVPKELVVCDDDSSDGTVEIVQQFAGQAPFEVRVFRNKQNLGFGENFMKAARLCQSELIAWSDQDDLWMPQKLDRCREEFEKDPEVVLVVHSTQIGSRVRHGKPVVLGPLARYHSRRIEERILRRRSSYPVGSAPLEINARGNSSVVSRRLLDVGDRLISELPGLFGQFSGHDTWTSFLATATGTIAFLPDALVQYRQHGEQISGQPAPRPVAVRLVDAAARPETAVLDRLQLLATRAFFRASVLTQLAAQLDEAAGFRTGAGSFRDALDAQVRSPQLEVGFGWSALHRSAMWRRHGEVLRRRQALWRRRPRSAGAAAHLAANAARGDYGRAERGGLGSRLLARDLWRVTEPGVGRSA